jgi:nucleoside-diphosphate-sugar epimerase
MKVFISGLNGFVAGRLAAHLQAAGFEVTGSSRTPSSVPGARKWSLSDPPDVDLFQGAGVLVHCAHDFSPGAKQSNVSGTIALAEAARRAGVKRQVLLSSLSARPDAITDYGSAKYVLERHFLEHGDTIVRPGTVIGKGGLFGKMALMIRTKPILPLIDGGKNPITVIGIVDLCRALQAILDRSEPREYNLYYSEMPTLKDLLVRLRKNLGRSTLFIPAPAWLLLVPLTILSLLHVRTPVDIDNLKGYMKSQEQIHVSNLDLVLPSLSTIDEALGEI